MKEDTKQFIADKFTKKWIEKNKDMLKDYQELCHNLLMFRAMWGMEIDFIFKNHEEIKGRELGKGLVEELFDAQAFVEKSKEYAEKQFTDITTPPQQRGRLVTKIYE